MKILGIGVDIVENSRITKSLKNNLFISRIFSNSEILIAKKLKNKENYYSKRFAAKEAFAKSIGTGFRNNLNFKDISIINDNTGKPSFIISEKIKKIIMQKDLLPKKLLPNLLELDLEIILILKIYL